MKDYYKILGVAKESSEEEIKKAYRKLAHQHHPDKAGGNEDKFKEINEAYQVLSDKEKRSRYDRFGTAEPGGFGGGAPPGWENVDFSGFGSGFGGQGFGNMGDIGDIFETFFEGFGGGPRRKTYHHGSDLEMKEEITLEEAFRGIKKEFSIQTFVACAICKGEGGDPKAGTNTCSVCGGRGEVKEERKTFFGTFAQVKACDACHGAGTVPKKICETCKGSGRVKGERRATIEIIPGIQDGQIIQVKGMGEAGAHKAPSGDLYIRVHVKPHHEFEREGDNLILRRDVKLFDVLLGRPLVVPIIDGGTFEIEIPGSFSFKEPFQVSGKGMPHAGAHGRGDLLIDITLKFPRKLSSKAKELLKNAENET